VPRRRLVAGLGAGFGLACLEMSCRRPTKPVPSAAPSIGPSSAPTLPAAGELAATVPTGAWADAVLLDGDTLWVANYRADTLTRVDTRRRAVLATIAVGSAPFTIAAATGEVWVANTRDYSASRINVETNTVTHKLSLPSNPDSLAIIGDRLWILGSDRVAYIYSRKTLSLATTAPLSVRSGRCTVYGGALWATDFFGSSQTAVQIDPATAKTTLTVRVGASPIALSFGFGSGWVANGDDATVSRFDPRTGQILATIQVPGRDPAGIIATPQAVFVGSYGDGSVYRIDPDVNEVVASTRIGGAAQDFAFAEGLLWVTDSAEGHVVALRPTGS